MPASTPPTTTLVDYTRSVKAFKRSLISTIRPSDPELTDFNNIIQDYLSNWADGGWEGNGAGTDILHHYTDLDKGYSQGEALPERLKAPLCSAMKWSIRHPPRVVKTMRRAIGFESLMLNVAEALTPDSAVQEMNAWPSMATKFVISVQAFKNYSEYMTNQEVTGTDTDTLPEVTTEEAETQPETDTVRGG